MKPGALLFHRNFLYKDGQRGKKIIILLNDGVCGHFLVAKTTSKEKNKTAAYGCNLMDQYPNFFLPQTRTCLSMDTWVCLNEYYELNGAGLVADKYAGHIDQLGRLDKTVTQQLLECANE